MVTAIAMGKPPSACICLHGMHAGHAHALRWSRCELPPRPSLASLRAWGERLVLAPALGSLSERHEPSLPGPVRRSERSRGLRERLCLLSIVAMHAPLGAWTACLIISVRFLAASGMSGKLLAMRKAEEDLYSQLRALLAKP